MQRRVNASLVKPKIGLMSQHKFWLTCLISYAVLLPNDGWISSPGLEFVCTKCSQCSASKCLYYFCFLLQLITLHVVSRDPQIKSKLPPNSKLGWKRTGTQTTKTTRKPEDNLCLSTSRTKTAIQAAEVTDLADSFKTYHRSLMKISTVRCLRWQFRKCTETIILYFLVHLHLRRLQCTVWIVIPWYAFQVKFL